MRLFNVIFLLLYSNMNTEVERHFLTPDERIIGQNWCCISFIQPEEIIKQKSTFLMTSFLTDLFKNKDEEHSLFSELSTAVITYDLIDSKYKDWLFVNEDNMSKRFDKMVDFQTSTRAFKIRGVYDTPEEAGYRAKALSKREGGLHDIFVSPVGVWMPLSPSPRDMDKLSVEYWDEQLNNLHREYRENKLRSEEYFEQRKREEIEAAVKQNMENRKLQQVSQELSEKVDNEAQQNISEMRNIIDESIKSIGAQAQEESTTPDLLYKEKINEVLEQKEAADNGVLESKEASESEVLESKEVSDNSVLESKEGLDNNVLESKESVVLEQHTSSDYISYVTSQEDPWMAYKMNKQDSI